MSNPIPDAEPDDGYSADDTDVDWSNVDDVAKQVAFINAIGDPAARLAAAKAWAAELAT